MAKGEITRAYPFVQAIITDLINANKPITTPFLQQLHYKGNYSADSMLQNEVIYGCIMRGRAKAIEMLNGYLMSDEYRKDMKYVEYNEAQKCDEELKSEDFAEFHNRLFTNKFGGKTKELMKLYPYAPALAVLWKRKLHEYSQAGHNFLIATYGNTSSWFMPTFWRWNIRDFNLYKRTIQILKTQIERGKETKLMLPSGMPLEKVLEYQTVMKAALEDGTAWQCSNCTARNTVEHEVCVICGFPRR